MSAKACCKLVFVVDKGIIVAPMLKQNEKQFSWQPVWSVKETSSNLVVLALIISLVSYLAEGGKHHCD
jgi:hypothetical protein